MLERHATTGGICKLLRRRRCAAPLGVTRPAFDLFFAPGKGDPLPGSNCRRARGTVAFAESAFDAGVDDGVDLDSKMSHLYTQ